MLSTVSWKQDKLKVEFGLLTKLLKYGEGFLEM